MWSSAWSCKVLVVLIVLIVLIDRGVELVFWSWRARKFCVGLCHGALKCFSRYLAVVTSFGQLHMYVVASAASGHGRARIAALSSEPPGHVAHGKGSSLDGSYTSLLLSGTGLEPGQVKDVALSRVLRNDETRHQPRRDCGFR